MTGAIVEATQPACKVFDLLPFSDYSQTVSSVDVIRCDIAQPFMIAAVVIVFNEGSNSFLKLARHIVEQLVDFSF